MFSKPVPFWIKSGGFTLATMGGCINAVALLSLQNRAVSHLSGTVTSLGIELMQHDYRLARTAALIIVFFFLGSVLSAVIIRQSTLKAGRRYGVTLMIESVLLVVSAYLLRHGEDGGLYGAAMACGLQNGMATSYSGAVIRTTHVTGIVTDFGIAVGLAARGVKSDWRRLRLYLVLFLGFLIGGALGAVGFSRFGSDTLLFPAAAAGVVGLGYTVWKHFWPAAAPIPLMDVAQRSLRPVRKLAQAFVRK